MDEPVADMVRGVLDGHVVLDRAIAERGRFPAIDILKSVSRSYSLAIGPEQGQLQSQAKALMAAYDQAEVMIQTGLYQSGSDVSIDKAILARPKFESLLASNETEEVPSIAEDRARLADILDELADATS